MKVGSDILKKKTGVVAQDLLLSLYKKLTKYRDFLFYGML